MRLHSIATPNHCTVARVCQDGRSFLLVDFNIVCDAAYRSRMYPIAFVALGIYAGGVPITFLWRLYMHREVLAAPGLCTVAFRWSFVFGRRGG